MPVYEYRCNACQREFEIQQKMSDDDLVRCEACGEDKLEKLISWSAFRLGGMGDAAWTKGLKSGMTPEQQREVARSVVDKGAPPKREPKSAPADASAGTAAGATADASTTAPTEASATPAASAASTASDPAAPSPTEASTEAVSTSSDGTKP